MLRIDIFSLIVVSRRSFEILERMLNLGNEDGFHMCRCNLWYTFRHENDLGGRQINQREVCDLTTAVRIDVEPSLVNNSLKSKGLVVNEHGMSVKTSKRFDRDDYVDATQRCARACLSKAVPA